jgi:uncharacterized protein (TIGR03066 family)
MAFKDMKQEGKFKVAGDKLTLVRGAADDDKKEVTIKKLTDKEFVASDEKGKTVEFKKK